jgi:putative membrane protein
MSLYKSKKAYLAILVAVIMGASACDNNKAEDPKEVAEEKNEQKFDNKANEKDAEFLVAAAEINREEISLGQLAQQKSTMSHVKELGKMMEVEHSKSLTDVTALAKTKNISLPTALTENGQDAYKKLNEKTGTNFDKDYSDMMVKGHKDAIALFEKAATECADADIRAWATATVPTLQAHLNKSLECQAECAKMK